MVELEKLKNELVEHKDKIYNIGITYNNDDFKRLIDSDERNLKEIVILLHSNSTSENKEMINGVRRLLLSQTDNNIRIIDVIMKHLSDKETSTDTTSNKAKGLLSNINPLERSLIYIVIAIVIFWIMSMVAPDAFKLAINAIKDLLGKPK